MLEILVLIFITRSIGKLAIQKGLSPGTWKLYTIGCWFLFEIIGVAAGIVLFKQTNLLPLMFLGLICAFGGYLLIRAVLQGKPGITADDDINRIGIDDLKP